MKVMFVLPWTTGEGIKISAGHVAEFQDAQAQELIRQGVARRHEVGPTETKTEDTPPEDGDEDEEETTP